MAKKKMSVAKSTRELARKLANLDGKYKGLTQKESELAFKYLINVMAAEIVLGRNSVLKLLFSKAHKKAKAYRKANGIAEKIVKVGA